MARVPKQQKKGCNLGPLNPKIQWKRDDRMWDVGQLYVGQLYDVGQLNLCHWCMTTGSGLAVSDCHSCFTGPALRITALQPRKSNDGDGLRSRPIQKSSAFQQLAAKHHESFNSFHNQGNCPAGFSARETNHRFVLQEHVCQQSRDPSVLQPSQSGTPCIYSPFASVCLLLLHLRIDFVCRKRAVSRKRWPMPSSPLVPTLKTSAHSHQQFNSWPPSIVVCKFFPSIMALFMAI